MGAPLSPRLTDATGRRRFRCLKSFERRFGLLVYFGFGAFTWVFGGV